MAPDTDKVMSLVERELEKDPKISSQALYDKAKKVDSSVGGLTLRQFHAKYPLQVKRRSSAKKKSRASRKRKTTKTTARKKSGGRAKKTASRGRAAAASGESHDAVRKVLLGFAKDVSAAEGKTETIDVLSKVDRYVADILKASRG